MTDTNSLSEYFCLKESDNFFMVYGGFGSPPTIRHATLESARAEAERLAKKHKSKVYVLQTIGYAEPVEQPIKWTSFSNNWESMEPDNVPDISKHY